MPLDRSGALLAGARSARSASRVLCLSRSEILFYTVRFPLRTQGRAHRRARTGASARAGSHFDGVSGKMRSFFQPGGAAGSCGESGFPHSTDTKI